MKELGSYPADFELYFLMWNSVLFYPNPADTSAAREILHGHAGATGTIPCHQHITCEALVKAETKYPPRTCPHCHIDTKLEYERLSEEQKEDREIAHGLREPRGAVV